MNLDSKYYLDPRFATKNASEDLKLFLGQLPEAITLTPQSTNRYELQFDTTEKATFSSEQMLSDSGSKPRLVLETSGGHSSIFQEFRRLAFRNNYRIFSEKLGYYLPNDPYLYLVNSYPLPDKYLKVLTEKQFEPLFFFYSDRGTLTTVYAHKKGQPEIHIINPYLLKFLGDYSSFNSEIAEFSYIVAPDLESFVEYYDRFLIPEDFYKFFNQDLKILNFSHFPIINPSRKIFFKPYIYELAKFQTTPYMFEEEEGQKTIAMSRYMPGQSLEKELTELLSQENIADDFIRARVRSVIEFDRDKQDILTPRLILDVFVKKIKRDPKELRRTWHSIKK